jgi:hypothetical protein
LNRMGFRADVSDFTFRRDHPINGETVATQILQSRA